MAVSIAVTISRQFGAGGSVIGRQVARELGFQYLDQEIIATVAEKARQETRALANREERLSNLWETVLQAFSFGTPETAYPPPPCSRYYSDRELFQLEAEAITKIATNRNVVVVGRGGYHVLKEKPGLISVFLHADPAIRAQTLNTYYNLKGEHQARDLIRDYDRQRERYLKAMTGTGWLSAPNYHLCIDTGRLGQENAGELIIHLVKKMLRQAEE